MSATIQPVRPASPLHEAAVQFLRHSTGMLGFVIMLVIVVASVAGPRLYGVDPFDILSAPFEPPGADLLLGSDYLGRDVLAGTLWGGRASLMVGLVAALISVVIGTAVGALAAVMHLGRIVEQASITALFATPRHPYTWSLIAAASSGGMAGRALRSRYLRAGEAPNAIDPRPGCRFAPQCPFVQSRCTGAAMPLVQVGPQHLSACVRQDELPTPTFKSGYTRSP